jgi:hypothetical protein
MIIALAIVLLYFAVVLIRCSFGRKINDEMYKIAIKEIHACTPHEIIYYNDWYLKWNASNWLFNPLMFNIWTTEKTIKYIKERG